MLNEIDLARADLNLLVLFEVVLDQGHVGQAAKRLNLSASAVSHGLGRLRRMLGDPLFLRTPKGVVPTARALELAEPVKDVLARVRRVMASGGPFEAATSTRRFAIGAPDGLSAAFLPALLGAVQRAAPGIDLGVCELLPPTTARNAAQVWEPALAQLDGRSIDVAVLPLGDVPARFIARPLYDEDFVIAMRRGHPFARRPTLARFCALQHLVVSLTGDAYGFVDEALARQGLTRRIALTVPNFMMALGVLGQTELLAALPRKIVAHHARRFGLASVEPPLALPRFGISAVAPRVATMDAGVAWLLERLEDAARARHSPSARPRAA